MLRRLGRQGRTPTTTSACRCRRPCLRPPFPSITGLLAGGQGNGGLGFVRRQCLAAELEFARGAWLLCGFCFLVALAMRKRRRCRGIISPGFFRSPMAIYSDANGETGETCVGVQGRRIIVFFRRHEDRSWPMRLGGSVLGICA
ncbi:hypothetical protein HU200_002785 [Digitaria exilis]|uniref:Uncharacterized protein n=1 Tax=Digitaria exilis TaxID=1010633 RepID=A0A835KWB2_9POAL|nr:hypothetical protein HU200_002785 [Digitaria exilis]